jgi:membrane fusion protein, heavy metal efflux system
MNKKFIYIVILVLVFFQRCSKPDKMEEAKDFTLTDTMLYNTGLAFLEMKPVKAELKLFGKIVADENKLVEVFPLVGGNVSEVNVELGDYVEKGKILAVVRSTEVADYERQLIDAQSNLLVAQKNLHVAEDLFESKLNSERDVIQAKKELEKSQAELKRIQEIFHIYSLGKESEYYVKAPISGFVIEKKINRDMQLRPDHAEEIFKIAEIKEVWVMADVHESDISKISLGCVSEISTLSYPDKIFEGKVDRIFNILDPQTKTMKIRIKLQNIDYALKPEMNATVVLKYNENKEMYSIPASAIIFDKSKNFVMVYKSKKDIKTREVEVYKQTGDVAYISRGLKEGDVVIFKNQLFIYDALND